MSTIQLKHPVKLANGQTLSALTLRRPKVRDLKEAQRLAKSDEEREMALVALLSEEKLTPEDVEELDLADYAQVQAAFRNFTAD